LQELDVGELQNSRPGAVQKGSRLLHIKPQGRGINLDQLILGAQGREWQGRFGTGRKHHMTVRRRVLQKIRDRLMDPRSAEPMIVFEKQINLIFDLRQIVDQARQDRCRVDQVVLEDQPNRAGANVRTGMVQGLGYVKKEPRGFRRRLDRWSATQHYCRFARAFRPRRPPASSCQSRRRLDNGKSLAGEFGQDGDEPGTRDQPTESRRQDFGRQEWQLSPGQATWPFQQQDCPIVVGSRASPLSP